MVVGSTKDVKAAQELMRHSTSKLVLDLCAQALPENKVAASKAIAGSLLLRQPSTCTTVQSGQGTEEPVKLNAVNSPRRLARPRTSPFHGGNTGSNPVGDANSFQELTGNGRFAAGTKRHNSVANFWPGLPNRQCFRASAAVLVGTKRHVQFSQIMRLQPQVRETGE